ncbi:MAG: polysaccharide deacetylase family protein [Promethearchaeota archaeon]
MAVKIIIRIDDIGDKYDFYELRDWFISNYPKIPVAFYVVYSHYKYRWGIDVWKSIKDTLITYKWEIGGHSRNHHHLPSLSNEKLKVEIGKNLEDLENELSFVGLDYKITSFAYPYGEFDERVKDILDKNRIIHGLTYISGNNYESQINFPKNNLYEIGISCNATANGDDWNRRFKNVYQNGDVYILCLHTSHWTKAQNRNNLKRIFKSKSKKELYFSLKRFKKYLFKKSLKQMWSMLAQHIEYIMKFSDVEFITFKDLIE